MLRLPGPRVVAEVGPGVATEVGPLVVVERGALVGVGGGPEWPPAEARRKRRAAAGGWGDLKTLLRPVTLPARTPEGTS